MIEYEKNLLYSLIHSPDLIDEHEVRKEFFRDQKNRSIFLAIVRLTTDDKEVNYLSLHEATGIEASYIGSLEHVSNASVEFYVSKLREEFETEKLRSMLVKANDMVNSKKEPQEIIEYCNTEFSDIESGVGNNFSKIGEGVMDFINDVQKRYESGGAIEGVPTGFNKLNDLTSGFESDDFIVIAARPSIGKTAFMTSMAANIHFPMGLKVGIISSEMSRKKLIERFISAEGKIENTALRSGQLNKGDFENLMRVSEVFNSAGIYIDDTPNIKLSALKSACRRMKRTGCVIVFIDYLTLIRHPDKKLQSFEQVGDICKTIKGLARELQIPIVVLSQLNRKAEGKEPTLAELSKSGDIEQDADIIMFLHRKREEENTDLIIAKYRNGPTGIIRMYFKKMYTKFYEIGRG